MSGERRLVPEVAVEAWVKLVRAHAAALRAVEQALKSADLPPLSWYDVLLELERADEPLRPGALEARLLVAQYNLSRLLDRMQEAGLVERRACLEDRRGHTLHATEAGRAIRARMWPIYAGALRAAIAERLSASDLGDLAWLLGKLAGEPPSGGAGSGR